MRVNKTSLFSVSNPGDMMLPLSNLEANESDEEEGRPVGQFFSNTLGVKRFSHANGKVSEGLADKFRKLNQIVPQALVKGTDVKKSSPPIGKVIERTPEGWDFEDEEGKVQKIKVKPRISCG